MDKKSMPFTHPSPRLMCTGDIGDMQEVDLVVAPLSFTPDKSLVMETTVPYYHNNLAAVFKKRDPLLDKWRIYMR